MQQLRGTGHRGGSSEASATRTRSDSHGFFRVRTRFFVRRTVLIALAACLLTSGPAQANGVRDFSWAAAGVNGPTAEKPQSKLWFNDGSWWGVLFDTGTDAWRIFRFDAITDQWVNTGPTIDTRNAVWADALWDGRRLYVASAGRSATSTADNARLYRFSYDAVTKKYVASAGFPVNIVSGGMEAVVLDKDTTGTLWATYTRNNQVYVNHTVGVDTSWSTPFVVPVKGTTVDPDDISAVVSFGGQIGVMWSNQVDDAMYFATHKDGAPPTEWSGSRTAIQGPKQADDHISLKSLQADASGRVFAAVKTSLGDLPNPNPHAPLILLLDRDASTGEWSNTVFSRVADDHTRPIVMVNEAARKLYVLATTPIGGGTISSGKADTAIHYKVTDVDNPVFQEGQGDPLISLPGDPKINNATSSKQSFNSSTGMLVLASDNSTKYYMHRFLRP